MAEIKRLTDAEIQSIGTLLAGLVKDPRALYEVLRETRSIHEAINSGGKDAAKDAASQQRLELISVLDEAARGRLELAAMFWNDPSVKTMQDAGRSYNKLLGTTTSDTEDFRMRLFALQPTAVLSSLVEADKIAPQPSTIKAAVKGVFDVALSKDFSIAKQSIEDILDAPESKPFISGPDAAAVLTFFRNLQRLQALVRLPEDVGILLQASFTSAQQIAHTPRKSFVSILSKLALSEDAAISIHDHATTVDARNEQAWTALLASRSQISPAAVSNSSAPLALKALASDPKQIISYTSLFGEAFTTACDDCSSVTGPAAYLVDLLRMLKNAPSDPATPASPSLLSKLLSRRPDLRQLELSCSNTNVLIPYIDLVNEVMESFIKNLALTASGPVAIQVFNMDDHDTSEDQIAQAKETDYSVYRQRIATQVAPLAVFPYNLAVDMMKAYIEAFGSSQFEISNLFGSKYLLSRNTSSDTLALSDEVLQNALALRYFNLQPEDYIAITGSSIFTFEWLKKTRDEKMDEPAYAQLIGAHGTGENWGFRGDTADQVMISDTVGLPLVKDQLLPRASISMQDLLDILKSRFLGGTLALTNAANSSTFTGKIEELRLRHPTQVNPHETLTVEDCRALQCFIRLWRKLKWSISDLDCALMTFGISDSPTGPVRANGMTMRALAAVDQISVMTNVDVSRLLPLWGVMDTNGDQSVYARLFLRGTRPDPAFRPDSNGQFLAGGAKISEARNALLTVLQLTEERLDAILQATKIQDDKLDLANVSMIYRVSLFCKLIDINPLDYGSFLVILRNGTSPFTDPQSTLEIMKRWRKIVDYGVSMKQIKQILAVSDSSSSSSTEASPLSAQKAIQTTFSVLSGLLALGNTLPVVSAGTNTLEDVHNVAAMLFDPATALQVVVFVEGSESVSKPEKLSFYEDVLQKYYSVGQDEVQKVYLDPAPVAGAPEENAIAAEELIDRRRSLFLQSVLPVVRSRLTVELVGNTLTPLFPGVDPSLLNVLLSDVIRVGTDKHSPVDIFATFLDSAEATLAHGSGDAYFRPPSTDSYRFLVPDPMAKSIPEVLLDGAPLVFESTKNGWRSSEVSLKNGQAYHLQCPAGNIMGWSYATIRAPSQGFSPDAIASTSLTDLAFNVLSALFRAVTTIGIFKLNSDEVVFFQSEKLGSDLAVDFSDLTFPTIQTLLWYSLLRDRLDTGEKLLEFFKWTGLPHQEINITTALSAATGAPEIQIAEFLESQYPDVSASNLIGIFHGSEELTRMVDCFDFCSRIGSGLTAKSLSRWVNPIAPPSVEQDYANAIEISLLAQSLPKSATGSDDVLTKANNSLRDNRRTALVNFLLQQDFFKQRGVYDADGLFEYFLIDVQMGPCLETSRIKQAISTVQLYVQRCILGLEKADGVVSGTINMDRWKWMQKYRLWEANRKVFLYPENWLDPTLRDDKTEIFESLEARVLQNDLNQTSLVDQIKSYVYDADGIANLDVQSYLWDKVGDFAGPVHFFARTRTSPYIYFYRSLEIVENEVSGRMTTFWKPWSKINVDVPVQEVDADGKLLAVSGSYLVPALNGKRLFLFLPQFTLKTAPNPSASTLQILSSTATKDLKAAKYWELRIGWTEYRNGQWSHKQVSQATLSIVGGENTDAAFATAPSGVLPKAEQFPDVSTFKFWVRSRPNAFDSGASSILVIDVERWINIGNDTSKSYVNYPLGRFEMRGSQLMLADSNNVPPEYKAAWQPTIPTVFGKLPYSITAANAPATPGLKIYRGVDTQEPLLGIVGPSSLPTAIRNVKWTMSFNDSKFSKATGLIQDISTSESTVSYFTYPPIASTTTFVTDIFQHVLSAGFVEMSTAYDGLEQLYAYLSGISDERTKFLMFGKRNGLVHELSTPYAIYNWEVGVHVVMLIMERLQSSGQYDLALDVAHLVFDPTVNGTSLDRCWLFPPFKELAQGRIDTVTDILARLTPSSGAESEMNLNVLEWRKSPFNAHVVGRGRPLAYMKRIVMKYIEILIARGDDLFRQNTLEAIPLAIQQYVEASHVFGTTPQVLPKIGKSQSKTYGDLEASFDDFSNAAFDMELDFPFFSDPASRGANANSNGAFSLTGILKTTYFCVPPNPKLVDLRNLIDDRLYKIRNCQDINGMSRSLALFEPAIDPGLLVRATAQGISLTDLLNDTVGPMPNYRFLYLLQKAFEMVNELKSMGSQFLSVKEKRDAEALQNLRTRQDKVIQSLTVELRQLSKKETESQLAALEETRKAQVTRLQFYLALAGEDGKGAPGETTDWEDIIQQIEQPTTDELRMTSNEVLEMKMAEQAAQLNQSASTLDIAASIFKAIPDISEQVEPLGMGVTVGSITKGVAESMGIMASVMRQDGQMCADQGARASRKAGLIRQLQDRRLQANAAGREIKVTDKQIESTKLRLEICERDIQLQQQQVAHMVEMEDWLTNKYTSEQLYAWMDGNVRSLFYQTYTLANDLAKKVQKAFRFERGDPVEYIEQGYWDSSRDGLFSGENLFLSLKKLEAAYLEKASHDFEIVKNISLRQIQPWALISLRETGTAEFSIPETVFDFDFPGHYLRRIKSVGITIPCTVGPYTGVNATLTLVSHKYRTSSSAKSGQEYAAKGADDSRFQSDQIPISSIAVSQGQQDSGVFNLDFKDERYIPFEGAGAISNWRIELPPVAVRQFDYTSIADVVLHMRYTAMAGGAAFRKAATDAVQSFQKSTSDLSATEGMFTVLDLKSDYSTEWYGKVSNADQEKGATMTLRGILDRLPFFTRGRNVSAESVAMLVQLGQGMKIDVTKDLGVKGVTDADIALTAAKDIGGFTVGVAKGLDEKIGPGDWKVTFSGAALKAGPNRVFIVVRYVVS